MALLPKKTYSRRNNELSFLNEKEKENVDPFDELLSSPLKQEVQFQPLSFWGKKVKVLESKEKSKKIDCGLFEASDSDEPISPNHRKRKSKKISLNSKGRALQTKSKNQKLHDRRKNHSTAYSFITKSKDCKSALGNKSKISVPTEEFWKSKSCFLDNSEYQSETNISKNNCGASQNSYKNKHFNETYIVNTFGDFNNNFDPIRSLKACKKELSTHKKSNFIKPHNLSFQIYEDTNTLQEKPGVGDDEQVILRSKDDSANSLIKFDESFFHTLNPFQSGLDTFKFVSRRRHFNYPKCCSLHYEDLNSSNSVHNCTSSNALREELRDEFNPNSGLKLNNVSLSEEVLTNDDDDDDETLVYCDRGQTHCSLDYDDSTDKTLCVENESAVPFEVEESKEISMLECQGDSRVFDESDLLHLGETELEDLFLELLNDLEHDVVESSSTSDDTLSSFSHEDTVIKIGFNSKTNDPSFRDSDAEGDITKTSSNPVASITTKISDLSITDTTAENIKKTENEGEGNFECDLNYKDNSFSTDFRNVTTKRRGALKDKYDNSSCDRLSFVSRRKTEAEKEAEGEMEHDQSLQITGRASLDWNQTISFANPVFESTRVFDTDPTDRIEQKTRSEKVESFVQDHSYALKPGKKWFRSMSVLKQLFNGSIAGGRLKSTRITGRKFESFVQDMLESQNEKSGFFTTLNDSTASNRTVMEGTLFQSNHFPTRRKTVQENSDFENSNVDGSVSSISLSNGTLLEKSSLNITVKVFDPEAGPSAFRSALGVDASRSVSKKDSVQEGSSVSARDFILMQCGQEDVLPFEEYFNEKTLKNCRKIGEGVYGEVFMSSDAVIKIIPIEGADLVNGERQKTFEEIMSEVVIAAKLSNLRRGKKHRTDGFSEMKRCWCVKGKYPKYLMELWNEYDQLGSGSENDSPVMFKSDQLYIILELANGGKDLESYVFNSSAQSLSIFIQIAYSLAVAEKAFEFEHRDLHWGNVLISETKEKFASVFLDGVEYTIPTKGVKVCIIDFTLSRINHEGCCIFNDLSVDPGLFASEGDYQFEIYRLMLREVKNDWSQFRPKTNLFWLHYTIDKMIKMVHYKNKKTKVHAKHLKDLKTLECSILEHKNSTDFVLSEFFADVINK